MTHPTLLAGTAPLNIVVHNVQNPPSAINTYAFSGSTLTDSTFSLGSGGLIIYDPGTLVSTNWAFSSCTEQPNSNLTITIILENPIPSGINTLIINYGNWENLNNKNLLTSVSTLNSYFSTDSGTTYTGSSTSFDLSQQTIIVTYSLSATLNTNATFKVIIAGVQAPPTATTPVTANYKVATADSNADKIDQSSTVVIADTCVYTVSGGVYSPANPAINSLSTSPTLAFSDTPIITILSGDQVEFYFSPLANFASCSSLRVWRRNTSTLM